MLATLLLAALPLPLGRAVGGAITSPSGVAAMQVHDLHTSLAHYEAALALDSTAYEANWRAALALLDEGEQIPDSVKSPERDSLYARAERLARRAVAADSDRRGGHFALAAAVGRASLTMGKKERIRRATHHPRRGPAHPRARPAPRRGLPHPRPLERGDHAALGAQPLLREEAAGRRHLQRGVVGGGGLQHGARRGARPRPSLSPAGAGGDLRRPEALRRRPGGAAQLAALPDREIMDSVYRRQAEALAARIAKKK